MKFSRVSFLKASVIVALSSLSLVASADQSGFHDLDYLKSIDKTSTALTSIEKLIGEDSDSEMRLRAMRDAAMALGAQHGYAFYLGKLKSSVEEMGESMDSLFAFYDLMRVAGDAETESYLLPAVVKEVSNVTSVSNDHKTVSVAKSRYEIEKAERLVSRPPDWRQYIIYDEDVELSLPHKSLLPTNAKEKEAWAEWVERGWRAGIEQADMEMVYRFRRLGGDFVGMTKYLRFVAEGRIKRPEIVATSRDVIGGGDTMSVQNEFYNLVTEGQLVPNQSSWEPIILDNRESFMYDDERSSERVY